MPQDFANNFYPATSSTSTFNKLSFGINNILKQQQKSQREEENCQQQQNFLNEICHNNKSQTSANIFMIDGKIHSTKENEVRKREKILNEICDKQNDDRNILCVPRNSFNMADLANAENQVKAAQWRRATALFAAAASVSHITPQFYGKSLSNKAHLSSSIKNTCEKRVGHPYQSRMPARNKKPRTSFSKSQVAILETRFLDQKYLASVERQLLANELCMSDSQVKTWFQNRRTKWR